MKWIGSAIASLAAMSCQTTCYVTVVTPFPTSAAMILWIEHNQDF
jgi:hypothetical protein